MEKGLIIGITGRFGAGCTTTSDFFTKEKGFVQFRLSDPLKKIARKRHADFDRIEDKKKRRILQDIGDEMRQKSREALVSPVIGRIKKENITNAVIDGIRNHYEVRALRREFNNFFLLSIDAETNTRWDRYKDIYKNDIDTFETDDKRDAGDDEEDYGQKVKKCIALADILINNNKSFYKNKETEEKDDSVIERYGDKLLNHHNLMLDPGSKKPSIDELYMHYACSVALKSYCLQRQVGAVIVKENPFDPDKGEYGDSYVIATGCNNVPIGESDCKLCYRTSIKQAHFNKYNYCKECGVLLVDRTTFICEKCGCNNAKLPGKQLDLCRAVHAEEATILQAAKLGGVSLERTKLYTSTFPCMLCCKKIINTGIKEVIYLASYPMGESQSLEMFRKCKVTIRKYEGVSSIAFNQLFKKAL